MNELVINVPDIGDVDDVEVIEISVAVGDRVEAEVIWLPVSAPAAPLWVVVAV